MSTNQDASGDARLIRAADVQAIFREVNERIKELNDHLGPPDGASWVCECENPSCSERIALTVAEYELVRADGNRFALTPGHEVEAIEDIVDRHEGYVVVSKRGAGGIRALAKDPRSFSSSRFSGDVFSQRGRER